MVEVNFESLAPIAALAMIAVTIWGAARKFTTQDLTIQNSQKDIESLKEKITQLQKDFRELYKEFLEFRAKAEDKLK